MYVKTADEEGEAKIEPPFDRNMEVTDFYSWWNKWLGEYISMMKVTFVGALNGYELEQAENYSDSQWIIFVGCIIFTAIVLMNLLLAIVAAV